MGKAARERAKRAAAAAATPELIVVEEPTPAPTTQAFEEPTTTKKPWMCRVVGCTHLALERHEAPEGVVWLCGRCGRIARVNLAAEAAKQAFADAVTALYRPTLEHYERMRQRIYGQSPGVTTAKAGDLLEAAGTAPRA